ncbi:MAG: hypothetical protein M0P69_20630, partial [Bacteroidales bacterium]|nr:hypothetical protein [Bacteroidales bacterium]
MKVGKPFVAPKVKKVAKVAKAPKVELSPEDQLKANVTRTAGTIKAFQTNISLLEEDYADMPADKKAGPKGKEIQAKIDNLKKNIAGLEAQNTQATNTLKLAGKTEPKKAEPKKAEPKKVEPKTQSLNVLQAQLAALKATRAEYRKKLATGPEDAKEIKAKVEALNEKINATLAAINRASTTPDVKTKKSKTAKAKAKAKAAAKTKVEEINIEIEEINTEIKNTKALIAEKKARLEGVSALTRKLKDLKNNLSFKKSELKAKESKPEKIKSDLKPWEMDFKEWVKYAETGKIHKATGVMHPGEENAKTRIGLGEINGYSDRDIAHFYYRSTAWRNEPATKESSQEAYLLYLRAAVKEGKVVPKYLLDSYNIESSVLAAPKKDLDLADIQAKISKIKDQIAAAKAKFESTDKLAHQLKLLKESLESKLAESKEAPPKKPAAPKKPTPKEKDEALRKVNLANPTMSTAQQRAVKYLASGKTIKMAEGKKVHPSSETGLSTLKALEKKGVVKRAIDGTYSLADVFTSEGEIQQSLAEPTEPHTLSEEALNFFERRGWFLLAAKSVKSIKKAVQEVLNNPNFKAWFKQSKVVDTKGKPLVLFHGVGGDSSDGNDMNFRIFKTSYTKGNKQITRGAWFATDPGYPKEMFRDNVRPFFLSLQNPLDMRELGPKPTEAELNAFYAKHGMKSFKAASTDMGLGWQYAFHEPRGRMDKIASYGYDGIILKDDYNSVSYIAFKPEQIKSIYNRGTFEQDNPDMYQSVQEMSSGDEYGYISAHDAEQAIKEWTAKWRWIGNIHVVKDESQLPENVTASFSVKNRKTRGFYMDVAGDIYIISDNNYTYKELFSNLMHEAIGHHGLRMIPKHIVDPFLDQIWKDKQNTDRMQFINKNYAYVAKAKTAEERVTAQRRSAEEWIAYKVAETALNEEENPTWLDQFITMIRSWLRSMGINFKVTDAEIKTWLSNMRQAVVRGDERLWTKHGVSQAVSTENAAVWYSKMTDFLKSKIKGSTGAKQLRDTIKTWSDKGEFRTEELEWSGLLDWLTERSGKVSPQEV